MTDIAANRPPTWFWIAAGAGLLWETFGVASYAMHVGLLPQGEMDEAARALMESSPAWVTGLFAIAVFSGFLGTVGLVLRRRWARALLILSLVAVVLQFGSWLLLTEAIAAIGPTVFIMPAVITVAGLLLVWLANVAARRGWLR